MWTATSTAIRDVLLLPADAIPGESVVFSVFTFLLSPSRDKSFSHFGFWRHIPDHQEGPAYQPSPVTRFLPVQRFFLLGSEFLEHTI